MDVGGAYGGGKAGSSFDPITFVQRPQVLLRAFCWVRQFATRYSIFDIFCEHELRHLGLLCLRGPIWPPTYITMKRWKLFQSILWHTLFGLLSHSLLRIQGARWVEWVVWVAFVLNLDSVFRVLGINDDYVPSERILWEIEVVCVFWDVFCCCWSWRYLWELHPDAWV